MKKIYILWAVAVLVCTTACSQNKNNNNNNEKNENMNYKITPSAIAKVQQETYNDLFCPDTAMPRLSQEKYVELIEPVVQRYAVEPFYYIYVRNVMCVYNILVNDMPEHLNYKYQQLASPTLLNTSILRSGKQRLTIRLYPVGEFAGENYTTFTNDASLGLTLYCRNFRTGFTEEKVILEYNSPKKNNESGMPVFIAAGKDYYEINLEFDAEVPYTQTGWTDGQDLTKLDAKKLEKETLRFFHKQWLIYKDRKWDAWYSYLYRKEAEVTASLYHSHDDLVERGVEEDKQILKMKDFQIKPMDDCVMTFYGKGRVIRLEQSNPNPLYRSRSSIVASFIDDEGYDSILFRNLYVYLPKGRELKAENFVIIR